MGDAQTAIGYDMRRDRAMKDWLDAIAWVACAPKNNELCEEVVRRAQMVEEIPQGFDSVQMRGFVDHTRELLCNLQNPETRLSTLEMLLSRIGPRETDLIAVLSGLAEAEQRKLAAD